MKLPKPIVKDKDGCVNVIIETPRGSRNKFTFDEDTGLFKLGKILPAGTAFPLDFGFIPGTKGQDGDPLDILILMEQPTYPGCLIECRLIGIIKGEQKDAGESEYIRNDRILGIPHNSVDYRHVTDIAGFGDIRLNDVIHFFKYYHNMNGGDFRCVGTGDADVAMKLIKDGKE